MTFLDKYYGPHCLIRAPFSWREPSVRFEAGMGLGRSRATASDRPGDWGVRRWTKQASRLQPSTRLQNVQTILADSCTASLSRSNATRSDAGWGLQRFFPHWLLFPVVHARSLLVPLRDCTQYHILSITQTFKYIYSMLDSSMSAHAVPLVAFPLTDPGRGIFRTVR